MGWFDNCLMLETYTAPGCYMSSCVVLDEVSRIDGCFRHSKWEDKMKEEFTKDMLEDRMVVECRNGNRKIVIGDILMGKYTCAYMEDYNDNLKHKLNRDHDIIKVFDKIKYFDRLSDKCLDDHRRLWERKDVKEVTMKEVCDKFGCEVKIIDG